MGIILAGVSHKTCPVGIREALASLAVPDVLKRLRDQRFEEAVILATCNRFEICAAVPDAEPRSFLSRLTRLMEEWSGRAVSEYAYQLSGSRAAKHLFSVAAGLDSLVVGEAEILGQVKQAYEAAQAHGTTGKVTNVLFQRALHVGKLVRTETGISAGQSSVASVAVALAERIFGSLQDKSVLILGAGQMAELTAKHLLAAKVRNLAISNRTWEKGLELATRFEATAVHWKDFPELLKQVDIVIGSTGAAFPVLTRQRVKQAMAARKGRSLFLIDIAMPRDVEASVQELDQVYLYAMEDLQEIVRENLSRRQKEIEAAARLVEQKAVEFDRWLSDLANGIQPTLRHSLNISPVSPAAGVASGAARKEYGPRAAGGG
jgi:glutamyl-tRNA reductase